MAPIHFPPPPAADLEALRAEVRDFLAVELADRRPRDRARTWTGFDAEFSRKMGARGWIGMTWPKEYGGQDRSALERYVVLEEMLAAGAPVAAHWIADRQSGPLLLKVGTEEQRRTLLPRIAAGECYFCIGMSEPDSGSDLAAVRTRAVPVPGGFRVNGTKLWTTYAHKSHYMLLFCRTGDGDDRHDGTSQLLVDLNTPGITIRPIEDLGRANITSMKWCSRMFSCRKRPWSGGWATDGSRSWANWPLSAAGLNASCRPLRCSSRQSAPWMALPLTLPRRRSAA